jgi:hypothetical protein
MHISQGHNITHLNATTATSVVLLHQKHVNMRSWFEDLAAVDILLMQRQEFEEFTIKNNTIVPRRKDRAED